MYVYRYLTPSFPLSPAQFSARSTGLVKADFILLFSSNPTFILPSLGFYLFFTFHFRLSWINQHSLFLCVNWGYLLSYVNMQRPCSVMCLKKTLNYLSLLLRNKLFPSFGVTFDSSVMHGCELQGCIYLLSYVNMPMFRTNTETSLNTTTSK